jgi:hypothetical protein
MADDPEVQKKVWACDVCAIHEGRGVAAMAELHIEPDVPQRCFQSTSPVYHYSDTWACPRVETVSTLYVSCLSPDRQWRSHTCEYSIV